MFVVDKSFMMDNVRKDEDCHSPFCMFFSGGGHDKCVNESIIVNINWTLGVQTDNSFIWDEQITKIKKTIVKSATAR